MLEGRKNAGKLEGNSSNTRYFRLSITALLFKLVDKP